ncbi:MAG: hypothetical protein OEY14_13380 [Myxococcales bacterium]|nr:hypothetical protein [Myxococcales bacterium]
MDGDPTRLLLMPTAFRYPRGRFGIAAPYGVTALGAYGVTDNLQVGIQAMAPLGLLAGGASIRVGVDFSWGSAAIQANALGLIVVAGGSQSLGLAGGGPLVSIGTRRSAITIGVQVSAIGFDSEWDGPYVTPHLGASLRVLGGVRVLAELLLPTYDRASLGELLVFIWGVRIFGGTHHVDAGLIMPLCPACTVSADFGIGIPLLTYGAHF